MQNRPKVFVAFTIIVLYVFFSSLASSALVVHCQEALLGSETLTLWHIFFALFFLNNSLTVLIAMIYFLVADRKYLTPEPSKNESAELSPMQESIMASFYDNVKPWEYKEFKGYERFN